MHRRTPGTAHVELEGIARRPGFDWSGVVDYIHRYEVEPPLTQYELTGLTAEYHARSIPVVVPPLWHTVVTARLAFPPDDLTAFRAAQERFSLALETIERFYPPLPGGLFVQVAYGLPYFRERIPHDLVEAHMPKSTLPGTEGQWAVIDSIRFPQDPEHLILDRNDMAFHLLSDFGTHVDDAVNALFEPDGTINGIPSPEAFVGDILTVTSIRRGFVGHNMPRLMGMRAGIPGAEKIPEGAMLFMGFTSTGADTIASGNAPSFETIPGFTDATPESYFAHGTAMHLSHSAIDLEAWYAQSPEERLHRMYHPRRREDPATLTHWSVPLPFPDRNIFAGGVEEIVDRLIEYDADRYGVIGHGMQVHGISRIFEPVRTAHGEVLPPGSIYFLREDFSTIDNPFAYASDEEISPEPHAGLHFVGFGPSSQHFEIMRTKMDSPEQQQRYDLPQRNIALARFAIPTHRQNFLLPPRAHRSMPLAELIPTTQLRG